GFTAKAITRPEATAGPIKRKCNPEKVSAAISPGFFSASFSSVFAVLLEGFWASFSLRPGLPGGGSCFLLSGGCCWFCAARQVFEMDVNAAKTMRMELKVRKNDRYELTETPFHRGKPRRPDTT